MLKRMTGIALLLLFAAAPMMLSVRPALAVPIPTTVEVCYVGTGQFRYGIVLEVTSDQAKQLVRKRRASLNFIYVKATFQGYQVCKPTKHDV